MDMTFPPNAPNMEALRQRMVACRRCPRLVAWREGIAHTKVKRYAHETYWGKAIPSFGDSDAELLIAGLAPAAHGGNRTGRMFTGDRSGDWLYRALHKAGFANQATSTHLNDGLILTDCFITAVLHCAPPDNKPLPDEILNCRPFLAAELAGLKNIKVVVALGKIAFDALLKEPAILSEKVSPKPKFGHGLEYQLPNGIVLIGSYHPSQQNTFTGRLTEPMFDAIFERTNAILKR